MKIVYQNRAGEILTRESFVGERLVGMRLASVTFETATEIAKLATDEGRRWLLGNLKHAMKAL